MKTIILALVLVSSAMAGVITLTMDEVAPGPINGLTVSKGGLDFTFSDASGSLLYNSFGPGSMTFVQDPSIQGPAVPFEIVFSLPVYGIQFGLAESIVTAVPLLATVSLYNNSAVPFATASFGSSLIDPFAEGQFNYAGGAVTKILITPNAVPPALAFDNLTVNTAPEPSTFSMLAGTAVLAAVWIRRRRRQ